MTPRGTGNGPTSGPAPLDEEQDDSQARAGGPFAALRHRQFALFWSAAFVSNTGVWLSNLTVPYVIYAETRSALWVSAVTVAQFVPSFLLTPIGGVLADRHERRRVLLVTQSGLALSAMALYLFWMSGGRAPAAILAFVALGGIFQGINLPSWQAFVNDLVPRQDLRAAVALNSLQFNAARSVGPMIAGASLAIIGPGPSFLLNALSFTGVLAVLALVRAQPAAPTARDDGPLRELVHALAYVRRQPGIGTAIIAAFCIGAFGNPIFQFTVIFAGSVYEVGPLTLGLLNTALGLGVVAAAPVLTSGRWPLGRLASIGMIGHGLSIAAFGLSPGPLMGAITLLLVGTFFLTGVTTTNTAVQLIVAEPLRGRVIAVRTMAYIGSFPIGAAVTGALAEVIGPRATVTIAGAALVLSGLALTIGRGRWRMASLDDPHDSGPEAPSAPTV